MKHKLISYGFFVFLAYFWITSLGLCKEETALLSDPRHPSDTFTQLDRGNVLRRSSLDTAAQSLIQGFMFDSNEKTALSPVKERGEDTEESIIATATTWDNNSQFAAACNSHFFKGLNRHEIGGAWVGAFIGLAPSSPACGLLLYSIGDTLRIPLSGPLNNALIVWNTVTMAPAFMRQFYERFQFIATFFTCNQQFKPRTEAKDLSTPHVVKISKFTRTALLITCFLDAVIPTVIIFQIEKDFPGFAYSMGPLLGLSWLENLYKTGLERISLHHIQHMKPSDPDKKREVLLLKLASFLSAIEDDAGYAEQSYTVLEKFLRAPETEQRKYLGLSLFFLKNYTGIEENTEQKMAGTTARLVNSALLRSQLSNSQTESFLSTSSLILQGLAIPGRVAASKYIIKSVLQYFSVDEEIAEDTSWALASAQALIWTGLELKVQQKFMTDWPHRFSCHYLKKFACFSGAVALLNGGFFALSRTIAAAEGLSEGPTFLKELSLGATFLTDLGYFSEFFREKYARSAAAVLATPCAKKGELPLLRKKAILKVHADRLAYLIQYEFDKETIDKFYKIILDGF